MIDFVQLGLFLAEAHNNTYAAEKSKPIASSRPGSTDFDYYNDSDFFYRDSYFGERRFIGEELVYLFSVPKPVWGMNYFGYIAKPTAVTGVIYSFLKKALRIGIEDGRPLRGPDIWETEIFKYEFALQG